MAGTSPAMTGMGWRIYISNSPDERWRSRGTYAPEFCLMRRL